MQANAAKTEADAEKARNDVLEKIKKWEIWGNIGTETLSQIMDIAKMFLTKGKSGMRTRTEKGTSTKSEGTVTWEKELQEIFDM